MQHQAIGLQPVHRGPAEQHKRRTLELDRNFGGALGQGFAGAQVEWHIRPAPIIDEQFHRDEGLSAGIGRHHGLGAIRRYLGALHQALAVLASDGAGQHLFVRHGRQSFQNFGLLVANYVSVEGDGRLHGGERDELENVVGHHVAQRSGLVVVHAALLYPNRFGHRDLDMVDVTAVPYWLEDTV